MCLGCLRSTKTTIAARTMVHPAQSTATPFFTTSLHRTVGLQTNCTALLVRPSGARTRTSLGLGLFIMDNFTDCKCFPATRTARGRAQTSVPSTCCRLPTLTRLCVLSGLPLLRGQTRALSSLLPCQQRVCLRAVCAQQKQLHGSTVSANSATSNGRTRVAFATLASSVAATSRDSTPNVLSTPSRTRSPTCSADPASLTRAH